MVITWIILTSIEMTIHLVSQWHKYFLWYSKVLSRHIRQYFQTSTLKKKKKKEKSHILWLLLRIALNVVFRIQGSLGKKSISLSDIAFSEVGCSSFQGSLECSILRDIAFPGSVQRHTTPCASPPSLQGSSQGCSENREDLPPVGLQLVLKDCWKKKKKKKKGK